MSRRNCRWYRVWRSAVSLARGVEGVRLDSRNPRPRGQCRQCADGRDPALPQAPDLMARDMGDAGEVIGHRPTRLATARPATDATVITPLRGRDLGWLLRECLQSPLSDRMVVNKIGYPQRHPLVVSQLHVHLGRRTALLAADESRITRELDDVLGLGSTGQFGVE